jgi:tripartite-type tricarboxylate transporter receptor subunit TctC
MKTMNWSASTVLCFIAVAALTRSAIAQYPAHPLRLIVPYAAGGNADIMGRMIAQSLTERMGQQVVVDNRVGANSIIGTELAAKAVPDGYTLLFGANQIATNVVFTAKLPYDTVRDFAPISLTSSTPLLLIANLAFPAKSVSELITLARAKSGQINYSSSGNGSPANLAGALFNYMAGVDIAHVPYKGIAQATTDVIGGQIEIGFPSMTSSLPYARAGKLRALAMTAAQRSQLAPDIPTVAESGLPGYQATIWNGVLAPAGTPRAIIDRINREITTAMKSKDTTERYVALGGDPLTSTPEEFAHHIRAEIEKWGKVARAAGIKIDLAR